MSGKNIKHLVLPFALTLSVAHASPSGVPSAAPIFAPWPQVYDYSAMAFESVETLAGFSVLADGSDSVLRNQVEDKLSVNFTIHAVSSVRVFFINPENILKDGSFEVHTGNDLTHWTEEWINILNQYDTSQSVADGGSTKLLCHFAAPYITRLSQDVSVEPNTEYGFEVWSKTSAVDGVAYAEVYNMDPNGTLFSYYQSPTISGSHEWQTLRGTFNSGSHPMARFYVRLHGQSGTAWFDRARIFKLEEPLEDPNLLDSALPLAFDMIPQELRAAYEGYHRGLAEWQKRISIYSSAPLDLVELQITMLSARDQGVAFTEHRP
jgi:hypothetical protein